MGGVTGEAWLALRTFRSADFEPVEGLVEAKGGARVSVVLPARNEALTIGPIVTAIRQILMERHPLVDELLVVDGGSSDETARIATDGGARVVRDTSILPEHGTGGGKGDALWKSLLVTSGDIIVWVDADIRNFHPRFVYGLVGPLLRDPSIRYVKAFYERPIAGGDRLRPSGGGRVTELVARPLINLFWPDLGGLVQPLSGEYAGRRSLLERIPFSTGYGVELGMLVDILEVAGIDAIGQVDLETRVHRNQSLPSLARMSFGIMQTTLARLERSGRIKLQAEPATAFRQFQRRGGYYVTRTTEIETHQRPPMVSLPEYRARRPGGRA